MNREPRTEGQRQVQAARSVMSKMTEQERQEVQDMALEYVLLARRRVSKYCLDRLSDLERRGRELLKSVEERQ